MPIGPNSPYTSLDQNQILQRSFDETEDRLRVDAQVSVTLGTVVCEISAASGDNIAITNQDGSNPLVINSNGSLNAIVSSTDLDIRNLTFATDKIDVTGSSVTVSSNNLDIRDLTFASDKVDVSGSSVTVSATDLDIRNLSHTQDSVKIGDGTDFLGINTDGSINVLVSSNQTPIPVNVAVSETRDVLGIPLSTQRYNQLEINFETVPGVAYITNTLSGGSASISATNGHTYYSTGTSAVQFAKGVSVQTVTYRPGNEIYSMFTASFTISPPATSFQRIGLYDTNDGFFIGYEGTSFGITKRFSTIDTHIDRASFNSDLLNGSVGSKFTRNGIPEAINLSYSNLFRIRFAWLGSANILFEAFSPDGEWILFHNIKQPNSDLNPSVTNPNLPMTIHVNKTASATDIRMYTACWAAGATSEFSKLTDILTDYTLATLTRSVITGRSSTGGGTYYNVKVNPSGSLLTAIGDITDVAGQKTMANSFPVVIASNQSTVPVKIINGIQNTYAAAAIFTYAANGTDIFTITGSATKTVRIKHISIDGTQTSSSVRTVLLIKRSSPNVGGTSTIATNVPFDSSNPAATATVQYYSVNPTTLGTTIGSIHNEKVAIPAANGIVDDSLIFSTLNSSIVQDITLRGTNEVLSINMNGVTSNGNSMGIDIIWTEE